MSGPSGESAIVAEIISSEKSYVRELRTCLEVYLKPLKLLIVRDPIISRDELKRLECNIEAVFNLSKNLLWELEHRKKCPGELFSEQAEAMRVEYVRFVSMYLDAYELHSKLMKQRVKRKNASQSYAHFVSEASDRQKQRIRNRSLPDFLILPIQRVPRYRLLLIELWRKLSPGLARDWTKEAVLRVSAVATEMNRCLSQATSRRKLIREETIRNRLIESNREEKNDSESRESEDLFAEEDQLLEKVESLSQNLYRVRNPTLFNLDVAGDGEDDESKEDSALLTREEELEHLCLSRGWIHPRNYPSTNPFILLQIVSRPDPFSDIRIAETPAPLRERNSQHFHKITNTTSKYTTQHHHHGHHHHHHHHGKPRKPSPMQITMRLLKGIYSPMLPPRPFHPRTGDIVVAGPVRCGQTPILHILESLRAGSVVPVTSLLDRVAWLESDDWDQLNRSQLSVSGRLIKTHARLNQAFGGVLVPTPKNGTPEFKVVAVLRHPADLRLSLFRHCRRLYRKCGTSSEGSKDVPFDSLATVNDFASALPFYESYVADVLRVSLQVESPQIMVVFYEHLLVQPKRVIQKLAEFIGVLYTHADPNRLVDEIAHSIKAQMEYPASIDANRRIGSSGQGRERFSKSAIAKMEENWASNVTSGFSDLPSYEAVYLNMTQSLLPGTSGLPISIANQRNGKSTQGAFRTLSQSIMAPVARFARTGSFNSFLGGPNSEPLALSSQKSAGSRKSIIDRVFETNSVQAEEIKSITGSLAISPSDIRPARATHVGLPSLSGYKRASDLSGKRTSDTMTSNSDNSADTMKSGTNSKLLAIDPDDSDDDSSVPLMSKLALTNKTPNIVGERM